MKGMREIMKESRTQETPAAGSGSAIFGNMSGRARMSLVASLVLLGAGFLATSYFVPRHANAWPTKYSSCVACHTLVDPTATMVTAVNGALGSAVSVAAGGSFEVDWKVTGATGAPGQVGLGMQVALPTGWTVNKGTLNAPAITGWNSVWDAAGGATGTGWATANMYTVATEFPSSPNGYTINYNATPWDTGTRNAAYDNASAGDLDGIADNHGADAIVTVPAGAAPGTYSVLVQAVGHEGSTKSYVTQTITVTVTGGADATKPVVSAGFAATTPSLSRTISVSGFAATDNVGVTGYMITTSSTAPLSGDAGWLGSAPTSYVVGADGSFTLYPWAKDAAGNVSLVYGAPVAVTVDTVLPTVSTTVPANGATAIGPNNPVTINFSESVNCATVTTGSVTIAPSVTWNQTSCSGSQAVFTPSGQASTTSYTVTVGTGVQDAAGNAMAASYPFSYTTSTPVTQPDTAISAPAAAAVLATTPVSITGSATVGSNPLVSVQVSTNNGSSWSVATGTTSWSYSWTLPSEDYVAHTILAKGVDNAANEDATPASITVRVDNVAPAGLSNSAPANTATNQATSVSLSSTTATDANVSGAVQYFFEIATDSGFTTGVQQSGWQTGTSYAPTLAAATTYYWHVRARDAAGNVSANTATWSFTTLGPSAPDVPSASQYKTDGVTAIAQGGNAIESSVVIKGTVSDANNDNVTLEIELITNGNSFAGVATCSSSAVASGQVASATCSGLTDGVSYKWRARTNDGALQSAWADFGGSDPDFSVALANTTPAAPSALAQYQADGTTVLASGAAATTNVVVIGSTVDGGNGDQVLLEVDLNNDGTADCASAYVTGPASAKATCAGLADGSYDWRVRAKDSKSAASAWTAYSGTPDFTVATGLDFGIDTAAPVDGSASANSGDGYLNVSWTSATDSGAGLDPVNTYKLVKATGSTAPADCSGAAIYTGNGTSYFDSAVLNGTTYAYRVCALDDLGNLSAGVTVSGSPSAIALPETAISAPAAAATLTTSPYSITGTAVAGGNPLVSVQVSTDNGGSWFAATGTTSWSYSWTLPAEDYVAHTILAKGVDTLAYADATPAQVTIRVDNVAPAGLAASTPANGATAVVTNSSLTSTTATDGNVSAAVQYFFELATNSGFTVGVQQSGWQTGSSFAPTLSPATTYYWHVRARDAAGNMTAFTTTWSFTTGVTAPETVLSAPAAASVLTTSPASITGSASAGTNPLGSVQVSTNNGSSWNTATGTGSWSYSWTLPAEDYVSHTILARALDNVANADPTPASVSVIVDNVAPTGVANSTPANAATGVASGSSIVASTASDANISAPVEYFFEIATNSGFTTGLQQSAWQTGTSWTPTLGISTTYYWHVRARDAAGNTTGYSTTTSFTTAAATVTVGQGTGESNVTLAPGAAQTTLDAFTLQIPSGTDTVTSVTVTLAAGTFAAIGDIAITDGSTTYGSVANPSSATVVIPLTTNITVTGSATQYLVEITPKSAAAMPAVPGSSYAVTGTVTAIVSTSPKAYSDSASATVTIDNLSPGNVTGAGGTPASGQNSLTWTNPGDSDFSQVVVLRRIGSAVADTPVEGTSYLADNVIGSSTVAYVGNGTGFTDAPLINGTVYHYKIFAKDSRGNYSSGGTAAGPYTPAKPYANNAMLHNSSNLGSGKWAANGGWGEPGKKYGAFTCATCHNQSTSNIKRLKGSIATPDGSTWGSNGATSVTVTVSNPATDYGNDGAHSTSARICEVCHSQTSYHKYNQTALAHNGTVNCTSECHLHSTGFKGEGGDCTGCHGGTKNDAANTDIGNDGTRAIVAEFSRASHHVTGVGITKQHCTMCHMEGNAVGSNTSTLHKNGQIDLRNVDTNAALVWTGTEHTNMDNFCMACHDGDGVANTTVRAIVSGATATNPFNSPLTNGYDQVTRPGVLNVKAQFAATNYSHHAVSGQRYTTSTYLFNASKFVSTFTPLGAAQTVRDTSRLHCADCHTVGQWATVGGIGGHGSTNEYMLQTSSGANAEHTMTTYVCYKCHVSGTYSTGGGHTGGNSQDYAHSSTGVGKTGRVTSNGNITGMACSGCHNVGSTGWGGIHGGNNTYVDGGGLTQNTYRFMPGMANSKYEPGTWSASSAPGCYTGPDASNSWGSCNQHSGGGKGVTRSATRGLTY